MYSILKAAQVAKQTVNEGELALINRQTLRPLEAEEVFTFRLAACDNQVDRDYERFTDRALEELAVLFVGKSVLMDHRWSAGSQTARVYAASVEDVHDFILDQDVKRLVLRCYMPRTEQTAGTITALESGILRECSVGCVVERTVCNICGANRAETCCAHEPGRAYNGKQCVVELDGATDAYEVSLVAVPAQPGAGVMKCKHSGGQGEQVPNPAQAGEDDALRMAEAMQRQEEMRYGGM